MGLQIDTQDIYLKFRDLCVKEIEILTHLNDKGLLPPDKKIWLGEVQDRLDKLDGNAKYRAMYTHRIMEFGNMVVGRPSRLTPLTLEQEKLGWQMSMRSWDYAIWLAGLATTADLRGHVSLPAQFIEHRANVALVMSDQVPVWLKIGQRKIVFAEHELAKKTRGRASSSRRA